MPDLQQIKEASDAAAFGSFASEVVLAISRFRSGKPRPTDSVVLRHAADLLDSLSDSDRLPGAARGAYSFSTRQTTQSAARLALGAEEDGMRELVDPLAKASRALADNRPDVDAERVDRLIKLFSLITDLQLARRTNVRMHRSTRSSWTATQLT